MLLTLTTEHRPATDLGFLLWKHPDRLRSVRLPFGTAHVLWPEATAERATCALVLEIDAVGLARRRGGDRALQQYVNDRPFVASSFLGVALREVFGSALAGTSRDRPELVERALPLVIRVEALPCRGGESLLRELFAPLGYTIDARRHPLDPQFPDWGDSRIHTLELRGEVTVRDALRHLYVLIPVLDDQKHYWIDASEIDKLLRHGAEWLPAHPARERIARRYLGHRESLTRLALARLAEVSPSELEEQEVLRETVETVLEQPLRLAELRRRAIHEALRAVGAAAVVDLGCGEGKLLRHLLRDRRFTRVVGVDVSTRALEHTAKRLHLAELSPRARERVALLHGSLTYRDARLTGFDAAVATEVIEHLDPPRLPAFERVVFECARPATVIVTTPNREYNARFPALAAGAVRHPDHRFEWSRAEFAAWAEGVAARRGYAVRLLPVGPLDDVLGAPTQMAVFSR